MALYWKIFLEILLAMTLTSQFPILLFLMVHWGWLSIDFLIKGRPWWILFFLSWAAILSPPDLFSQFLIFFPLLFFYESVVFFILCEKRWETALSFSLRGTQPYLRVPRREKGTSKREGPEGSGRVPSITRKDSK
jgi:Sec-independent protein secretion pathway component TatC